MKIAVITDSGSNYYAEKVSEPGLYCVSLQVVDDDKGYREGVEITPLACYDLISQGKMLKTASPLVADIEDCVDQIIQDGYDALFSVNITTGLSSTISTVKMIAQQKGLAFDYIDCFTTARVQLQCALKAVALFKAGKSFDEVKPVLQEMIDNSMTFVIPVDLNHLVRGGRISPVVAKLAGLLKISPVLYLNEKTGGRNESFKKVRTFKKALETVADYFVEQGIDSSYKVCIVHVKAPASADLMVQLLTSRIPDLDYYVDNLVPVVGVHTGLGCVALQYVKK